MVDAIPNQALAITPLSPSDSDRTGIGAQPLALSLFLLGAIIAIGLAVRCLALSERSFWFDEAFSWRLTQFPVNEMFARIALDNNPPLYYFLLKGWAALFGDTALALRSFSVLCGILTIIGTYMFVKEAFRPVTPANHVQSGGPSPGNARALIAAGLVALSVFQLRWATEVRMYTLGTALCAFSSWAFFRALFASHRSCRAWVWYALLALAFAYTHNYALFSIMGQAMFVLGYLFVRSRCNVAKMLCDADFWGAALAAYILAVGWLPWLPIFLRMRSQVQDEFWAAPLMRWDLPHICYKMFVQPDDYPLEKTGALFVTILAAFILLALLLRPRSGSWYVLLSAAVPLGLSVVVSAIDTKCIADRYFIFVHLFLLIALADFLWRLPAGWVRISLTATVFSCFLVVLVQFRESLSISTRPGTKGAAEFVEAHRDSDAPVVVASPLLYFSLLYHTPRKKHWYCYNSDRPVVHYEGAAVVTPGILLTTGQLGTLSDPTIWVVEMDGGTWGYRNVPPPPAWVCIRTTRFPDVYRVSGELIVRQYRIGHEAQATPASPN